MQTLVTGAAGFIGSHLCDRLLADGHSVVGIDSFTDYYSRTVKEANLANALQQPGFRLLELDLVDDDLSGALEGAEVVFHIAGRSGVRASRRNRFDYYVRDNVLSTERILEASARASIRRFVHASSSSVYGDAERLPTRENTVPMPLSSYGVTKLAAETLVQLYGHRAGLPVVVLRYFYLYGPRQRPDMAISRFVDALMQDTEIELFGDGEQTRDFTYIGDAIEATVAAVTAPVVGQVLNIGGGSQRTLNSVIARVEELAGRKARVNRRPSATGDHRNGCASINLARRYLGWEPRVPLGEGLAQQWAWQQSQSRSSGRSLAAV